MLDSSFNVNRYGFKRKITVRQLSIFSFSLLNLFFVFCSFSYFPILFQSWSVYAGENRCQAGTKDCPKRIMLLYLE